MKLESWKVCSKIDKESSSHLEDLEKIQDSIIIGRDWGSYITGLTIPVFLQLKRTVM